MITRSENRKNRLKGLLLVAISGFVYGLQPFMVSYCYGQGATPGLMVAARYGVVALLLLPVVLRQGINIKALFGHWKWLLCLCLVNTMTPILLYNSYTFIPTGVATSLHFLYPVIVTLLCALFFHDRPSGLQRLCTLLCFAGLVLILDLSEDAVNGLGVALALGSSLTWSLYIVWLDKIDMTDITTEQLLFTVEGISCLLSGLVYLPLTGTSFSGIPAFGWGCIIAASVVIGLLGTVFFVIGVRYAHAQTAAIASTLEPTVGIAAGILFLQEPFSLRTVLGALLIVGAIVLLSFQPEDQNS